MKTKKEVKGMKAVRAMSGAAASIYVQRYGMAAAEGEEAKAIAALIEACAMVKTAAEALSVEAVERINERI